MYRIWLNISISIMFSGIKSANHTNTAMVIAITNRLISSKQFSLYTFTTNLPTKYTTTTKIPKMATNTIKLSDILTISDAIGCSMLLLIFPAFSAISIMPLDPFTQKSFIVTTKPIQSATTRSDCIQVNRVDNMPYNRITSHLSWQRLR